MTAKKDPSPQTRKICDQRINYAKMKNEMNDLAQPLCAPSDIHSTASVDQQEALSRADGNHPHPINSDEETRTPETLVGKESAIMTAEDWKALGFVFETGSNKALQIDMARYQSVLDKSGLSDDQKKEIILELWKIVIAFVDLGFKVSPLDLACGKLSIDHDQTGNQDSAMVRSQAETLTQKFNHLAAD